MKPWHQDDPAPTSWGVLPKDSLGDPTAATAVTIASVAPVGSRVVALYDALVGPGVVGWTSAEPLKKLRFAIVGTYKGPSFRLRVSLTAPAGGAWLRVKCPAGWGTTTPTVVAGISTVEIDVHDFKPPSVGAFNLSWVIETRTPLEATWSQARTLNARVCVIHSPPVAPWSPTSWGPGGELLSMVGSADADLCEFAASSLRASPGWTHPARQLGLALAGPGTHSRPLHYNLLKVESKPLSGAWDPGGPFVLPLAVDNPLFIAKLRLRLPAARALAASWLAPTAGVTVQPVQSVDCAVLLVCLAAAVGVSLRVELLGKKASESRVIPIPWQPGSGWTGPPCSWMIACRPFLALGHDELWMAQPQPANPVAPWCDQSGHPHLRIHAVAVDPGKDLVYDASITGLVLPVATESGATATELQAPLGVSRAAYTGGLLAPGVVDPLVAWFTLPPVELDFDP